MSLLGIYGVRVVFSMRKAWLLHVFLLPVVVGCGGGTGRAPAPAVFPAATAARTPPSQPQGDPAAVCAAFATTIHTVDTAIDAGPGAAYYRARPYVTARLSQPINGVDVDARWAQWAAHRAATTVTATVLAAEAPPDSLVDAYRAVRVTVTPRGVDGWTGPTQTRIVFCQLAADSGGWRVDSYTTSG